MLSGYIHLLRYNLFCNRHTRRQKNFYPHLFKGGERRMNSQLNQDSAGLENANRTYSAEEDELILAKWWNKKLRKELAAELGRSEAALAQRFYAILKKRGLDPKTYRKQMKQAGNNQYGETSPLVEAASWSRDDDMNLWRWYRAGEDFATIAGRLPGRTARECQQRLESLKEANFEAEMELADSGSAFREVSSSPVSLEGESGDWERGAAEPRKRDIAGSTLVETISDSAARQEDSGQTEEESEDFLDALRRFPRQAAGLNHRMAALEHDMQYLKNNIQFVLDHLAKGLANVGRFLTDQKQDFTAFEQLKRENQQLRNEIAQLRQKIESDKQELRKVYNEIDFWLGEFMEMRKVEKVANLGELIPKLKYSYDKFGVLLDIEREA